MHCGGPTGQLDRAAILEYFVRSSTAPADEFPNPEMVVESQHEGELENAEEPSSIGRSLIRSLGGFVWVIVLIGFTLARNCASGE